MGYLDRTDGIYSRRRRLSVEQVQEIRRKYDSGLRGKTEAGAYKITPKYFDKIGQRKSWLSLPEETR